MTPAYEHARALACMDGLLLTTLFAPEHPDALTGDEDTELLTPVVIVYDEQGREVIEDTRRIA